MIITKTCNTCEHYSNDKHCIGCEWDKNKGENTKWELKKNPIVIERAVLNKIRTEIEGLTYYWCEINPKSVIEDVLQIINKYIEGSEE